MVECRIAATTSATATAAATAVAAAAHMMKPAALPHLLSSILVPLASDSALCVSSLGTRDLCSDNVDVGPAARQTANDVRKGREKDCMALLGGKLPSGEINF